MSFTPREFSAYEREVEHRIRRHRFNGLWTTQPFGSATFSEQTRFNLQQQRTLLRHLPDLLVSHTSGAHVLIECKGTTLNNRLSSNFTIQKQSLEACRRLHNIDFPVIVVWHDYTTSTPEEIDAINLETGRYNGFGTGTPYWLVNRSQLARTSLRLEDRLDLIVELVGKVKK